MFHHFHPGAVVWVTVAVIAVCAAIVMIFEKDE